MKTTKILFYLISFVFVMGMTPSVANADLVAYWPFDEGTGDVAYDAIGDNDGTITNCTWILPGKIGNAAIEDLETSFGEVNCGNGPTPTTQDLTLAWWMIDNLAGWGTIMDKSVTDSGYGYNILVRPPSEDSPLRFRIGGWQSYGGWGSECRLPLGAYNDGEWVHITCTYDSATDTATIYVNGELKENGSYNPKTGIAGPGGYCLGVNNPDTPLYILGGEENFDGILDEVAIWDTALTADEVFWLYRFGVGHHGLKDPSPADGATVSTGTVDLSWTNADPNSPSDSVYVDVWFGTEPNETHPNYDMTKVVTTGENTATVQVSAPTEGTYYWQVNSYIYGDPDVEDYDINGTDPNLLPIIDGPLWSFIALDDAPPSSVDAGADMISWSGQPIPLDATIVDDGVSALTYLWTADAPAGVSVAFDPSAAVEDPTVTLTKVPHSNANIDNAGFEDAVLGDGAWDGAPGWTAVGGAASGSWNPGETTGSIGYGGNAPEGDNIAWAGLDPGWVSGGLAQVLAETLAPDTTYQLTVEVGNSPLYDWPGYKVQLLAGGNLLAEDDNSLTIPDNTFATSTVTHTPGGASDPNIGLPLEIRLLVIAAPATSWAELNFDDVRLTANPPFPAPTGLTTVELTLAVNDESNPPVEDTMEIDVYEDACQAARMGLGLAAEHPGDIVGESQPTPDCVTDIFDLAEIISKWLADSSPTEAFVNPVQPDDDPVPNNSFEKIYKPGSTTITADLGGGWTNGVGPDTPMDGTQTATFSDGTTGGIVDIPGWINTPGWPPSYDLPKGCGSVTRQSGNAPDGEYYYLANGSDWGNPQGGAIESEAPLGTINAGTYTLSMLVNDSGSGGVVPVVLELLANGEPLTPSSTVDPGPPYAWTEVSKTYDPNAEHIGRPMTIRVGFGPDATGAQGHIDLVTLEFEIADPNNPTVDAGVNMVTWSGQAVQLAPTVVNNDPTQPTLSYLWTADPADGVVFSATDIEAPTVTITKATDNPSAVTLTLAVTRAGSVYAVTDMMSIDVYDTACLAAISTGTLEVNATDFDSNCITDLRDYAVVAATWLVDYALTAPIPKP